MFCVAGLRPILGQFAHGSLGFAQAASCQCDARSRGIAAHRRGNRRAFLWHCMVLPKIVVMVMVVVVMLSAMRLHFPWSGAFCPGFHRNPASRAEARSRRIVLPADAAG